MVDYVLQQALVNVWFYGVTKADKLAGVTARVSLYSDLKSGKNSSLDKQIEVYSNEAEYLSTTQFIVRYAARI